MQPLDVGVFQPYKHWHDMAIQDALLEFNVEYTLQRFLADLSKIRVKWRLLLDTPTFSVTGGNRLIGAKPVH